jgi:D-alanyl-D-alanine dipeptidase
MKPIQVIGALFLGFSLLTCRHQISKGYEQELGVISNAYMYKTLACDFPEKRLVDLETYIPGIALDIRYASKNNFTGKRIYPAAKAYLRLPAAQAIKNIEAYLRASDLGLKIFDAYRPYSATLKFYEVYPDTNFVAAPWHGSRHNRGCAVDLTIIHLDTGKELEMPTPFDDFTEKAGHQYMNLPDTILQNRALLKKVMTDNGFAHYDYEWWHYDFVGWENYKLLDIGFGDLE